MASIPIPARTESHPHLRPLNILRDLPAVADLIELCFSDTMDREGQRYVQDMRRAGMDDRFLRWATKLAETTSLPLTGYVWEEDGKLIGNASLVPFRFKRRRLYLIANVAVHPDHRRRGIARILTERALAHAKERRVASVWLHVRDDNPGAIRLYTGLGFRERARRTNWQAAGIPWPPSPIPRSALRTGLRSTGRSSGNGCGAPIPNRFPGTAPGTFPPLNPACGTGCSPPSWT